MSITGDVGALGTWYYQVVAGDEGRTAPNTCPAPSHNLQGWLIYTTTWKYHIPPLFLHPSLPLLSLGGDNINGWYFRFTSDKRGR
jgi:hypothetical protein